MSYVSVSDMYSPGSYQAPGSAYESITHTIESGAEWLRFNTLDGVEVMLRTAAVLCVNYVTDDAAAAIAEREDRERIA